MRKQERDPGREEGAGCEVTQGPRPGLRDAGWAGGGKCVRVCECPELPRVCEDLGQASHC